MENGYSKIGLPCGWPKGVVGSGLGFGFGFASACGFGAGLTVAVFADACFAAGLLVAGVFAFVCAEAAVPIIISDNRAMNAFFIKYFCNCFRLLIPFSASGCLLYCWIFCVLLIMF